MAKKVMLVDDDQNAVKFLSVVLEENGYDWDCAYDGKEGLEKIHEVDPDLVVLDVMMPKKSGFTLFKQLRRDARFADLPVLMLSGVASVLEEFDREVEETDVHHEFDSLREALRTNVRQMREEGLVKPNMFLDKPIDPDLFIERVRELIGD